MRVSGHDTLSIGPLTVAVDRPDVRAPQLLPDGSFIGMQVAQGSGTVTELNLIVNWLDELKRLAPGPRF